MPLYEYECDHCGPFNGWAAIAQATDPAACPSCDTEAPRAVSAPQLSRMQRNTKIAHERNEKSADAPQVAKRAGPSHQHHHGGGACAHSHAKPGHGHGPKRPWMIGH